MGDHLPLSIPFSSVREALESLGIPVDHTVSVTFGIDSVAVEECRIDPMGRIVSAGSNTATVTTIIGYEREEAVR